MIKSIFKNQKNSQNNNVFRESLKLRNESCFTFAPNRDDTEVNQLSDGRLYCSDALLLPPLLSVRNQPELY